MDGCDSRKSSIHFPCTMELLWRMTTNFLVFSMLLTRTSEAGTLEPYIVNSFVQPEVQATSLNHFLIHNRTGSVYIAANKYLYKLSSDLEVQQSQGTSEPMCTAESLCHDFAKILTIAPGDSNNLVLCKSSDGTCEVRNGTDLSLIGGGNTEIVVSGESVEHTSVGVIAPGPGSTRLLYVANTLSADGSIIHPIRRWALQVCESLLCEEEEGDGNGKLNHFPLDQNVDNFAIYYEGAFTHDGFVYFVMNQKGEDGHYISKLGRVCYEADSHLNSYTEITLRCNAATRDLTYNLVRAAHVGEAGSRLHESLGNDSLSAPVLYGVFSASAVGSQLSHSGDSAICVYSMNDVKDAFQQAIADCLQQYSSLTVLKYVKNAFCNRVAYDVDDSIVRGILCDTHDQYSYANGIQDLVSSAAAEFSSNIPSSVISAVDRHHTVTFVGTREGELLKVHLLNNTSGRVYETLCLGSSQILPDMYNEQDSTILTATENQLYRLAVTNCGQYSTCSECIGEGGALDGDPYCGWCTLEARCTRYIECDNAQLTNRWLAYDTAECISINHLTPNNLPLHAPANLHETNIRFTVAHLPTLQGDSTYVCSFNSIVTSTTLVGQNVTCLSPSANQLPEIQPGGDHIVMNLALKVDSTSTAVAIAEFVFYDCQKITSCSACAESEWPCEWCLYSHRCSSTCPEGDTIIAGVNSAHASPATGPSLCPRLLPVDQDIHIAVNMSQGFELPALNLPSKDASYECVLHVEGTHQVTAASIFNDTVVICEERKYTYTTKVLELEVPVSVRWNGVNYIDTSISINVTLYDCSFGRGSCSRCLSPSLTPFKLGCVWCGDECGVRMSSHCQGDNWIRQGSNQSCPGPVVSKIVPVSGPIEGNTLMQIFGSDLGLSYDDITSIELGSQSCDHIGLQDSYQVGLRVNCVTSGSSRERQVQVAVFVLDSQNKKQESSGSVTFTYKDPSILGFSPSAGIANGGTILSITGVSLQTGRNITAAIGESVCKIIFKNDTLVVCQSSESHANTSGTVSLWFDRAERVSENTFSYRPNPTYAGISPARTIKSGGVNLAILGSGFSVVQEAELTAALDTISASVECRANGDNELVCPSPSLGTNSVFHRRRRRRNVRRGRQAQVASLSLSLDGFIVNITDTLAVYPDPEYERFSEENGVREVFGNTTLKIAGTNLDLAVSKFDILVLIGRESCDVLSVGAEQLFCRLPATQPEAGDEHGHMGNGSVHMYPAVTVLHGSNLRFPIGYVSYRKDSTLGMLLVIIVAVLVGVAVIVILIAVSVYGRRVHQDKLKSAEGALIRLEERLKDKATEAFHDLQRDMSGLKEQLQGLGMPFVSGADYIRNMLFWGLKVQPMTKDPELPQEHVKQGMVEFSKRLNRKQFLMEYIGALDDAKTLKQKDRVNIASLLSVILTTEGRFHYLTDVMLTLMTEQIEDADENRLKQLFRRTESILEKLISNWIALCMYKGLQKQVAYPLYVLYQAIKGQCEKGPVDAVTGQAHFSLNFDNLLDEDIEFNEVTLQVVDRDHIVTEQVKVLDVDTITQAKQKILDAIYCKRQTNQQLGSHEFDLVLLNGHSGRVVLRDRDEVTVVSGSWIRANTIKTYRISNGSSVAIIKKQDTSDPNYSGPLALDKTELAYTYVPIFLESYSPWSVDKRTQYIRLNAVDSSATNNTRTSWEHTQIDVEPEEGKQMWHLVKDESAAVKRKGKERRIDHRPKLIKEVYTSRLLVTKNAVQHFLDEFLVATFSLPEGQTSLPVHIKFLFDFFDKQAERHGSLKDNIAMTWKNNSLPLRYWVTAISHPSFIFDMQQSRTADYCMNVLTNMLDNACKGNVPKYNLDASLNRVLYRPELPGYIRMVESYYDAIAALPEINQAQLEEASQQISKEFSSHFSRLGLLHQLYEFTKEHTEMLDDIRAIIEERDD